MTDSVAAVTASKHVKSIRRREIPTVPMWLAPLEWGAPFILAGAIVLYVVVVLTASVWQLHVLRFGFDPVIYEQPLWNTLHGHIMEQSGFAYTKSEFGHDLILFHFIWLPFYAIRPATTTLLLLQTLAAAVGAVPVYLIARDVLRGRRLPALLLALLYLSYVPLQNVNLYEISPRLFAATFLLFAYWCMTRNYAIAFWVMILLAISNRNDTALVVAAVGLSGVLTHRKWIYSWLPLIFGMCYWVLVIFIIVPAIAGGTQYGYLQNYSWLGGNALEIARTTITHPWFVFHHLLTLDRGRYLLNLLYPLAFLPLLQPRAFVIAAPPLLLNLLSGPAYAYQRDIYHQYSALAIPGLFIATILAVATISDGTHPVLKILQRLRPLRMDRKSAVIPSALVAILLLLSAVQQATISPNRFGQAIHNRHNARIARRVASLHAAITLIPNDAPLSVTNLAADRVPMRRYIYFFPGDQYYDPALINRAEYVLGDRAQGNGTEATLLDHLAANGQWEEIGRPGDFEVLHRVAAAP